MNYANRKSRRLVLLMSLVLCAIPAYAKRTDDVVMLKNGDRLTGEIKSLQRGELRFKAAYMAEAVRLDWARVEQLVSKDKYLIYLTNGELYTDFLRLAPSSETVADNFLIGMDQHVLRVSQMEVLRIAPIEARFWKQLEGSIDLGLNYTSGNDQYQAELLASATYRRGDHSLTASIDSAFSGQREGSSTARNQFTLDYRKQLSPKWYVGGLFDVLRSDQQSLKLRTTVAGVLGRNIVQTERTRFSIFGGLAANHEKYSTNLGKPKTVNADAAAGFDFVTYRFKTTDIRSRFLLYPSLTTPGRNRMQLTSDLRIEIFKDFYWGFHLYENFDSKPPVSANKNDLGVSTSFGLKF
jgi:putative salt-induced outer membrane protein YdiY